MEMFDKRTHHAYMFTRLWQHLTEMYNYADVISSWAEHTISIGGCPVLTGRLEHVLETSLMQHEQLCMPFCTVQQSTLQRFIRAVKRFERLVTWWLHIGSLYETSRHWGPDRHPKDKTRSQMISRAMFQLLLRQFIQSVLSGGTK